MPEVNKGGAKQNRRGPHADPLKSILEISVLEAPADILFVEAVHPLVIASPEADVVASQTRPHRCATGLVDLGTQAFESEPHDFLSRQVLRKVATQQRCLIDACGGGLIEPDTVAGHHPAPAPRAEVGREMFGGQDAIAVGKEQVRRRRCRHAFIAATRETKTVVSVRRERERIGQAFAGVCQKPQRLILRAVIGDDDFEASFDTTLGGERSQASPQMAGTFKRRHDNRHLHTTSATGT